MHKMVNPKPTIEPVYYYLNKEWYQGDMPTFYDSKSWPITSYLKENYPKIRDEIVAYYARNSDSIQANFTPYNYSEKGWKTINLYTYGLRYKKHCIAFPVLDSVVKNIPGMTMAQIAILEPGVRVKAHLGDTNAIVRNHMGISIPGILPELGLRVGQTEICWEEGEVFSFCIVHRHNAWNYTKKYRIVLIVDVIHPSYAEKKSSVCAESLALIAMKALATRITILKKSPRSLSRFIQIVLSIPIRCRLFFSRMSNMNDDLA
jgi:hypothetical protein